MMKMKKISAAILCALLCTAWLCTALIYAETDVTSKFSQKLLEYYEANDAEVKVYIHYEDTVDYALIEAQAAEAAEEELEKFRKEDDTEEELKEKYDKLYALEYSYIRGSAYEDLGIQMQTALGLEDSTTKCYSGAYIFGFFTYEEVLIIAENELVLAVTRAPEIESEEYDTEFETDNVPFESDDDGDEDETYPMPTTEPVTDPPEQLVGDLNYDGVIDATDAAEVLQLAAEVGTGRELTAEQLYLADYSSDGKADATDASLILIFAAKEGVA